MKCPHCLSVCLPTDPKCYSCKGPLSARSATAVLPGGEGGKPPYAQRLSVFLMCLGAAVGGAYAGALGGGVGAMIGGSVGLGLGVALFGTGKATA